MNYEVTLNKKVYGKPFHTEGDNKYYHLSTSQSEFLVTETIYDFSFNGKKDRKATTGLKLLRLSPSLLTLLSEFGRIEGKMVKEKELETYRLDGQIKMSDITKKVVDIYGDSLPNSIKFETTEQNVDLTKSGFDFFFKETRGNVYDTYYVKQTDEGVLRVMVVTSFNNGNILEINTHSVNQMIILKLVEQIIKNKTKEK